MEENDWKSISEFVDSKVKTNFEFEVNKFGKIRYRDKNSNKEWKSKGTGNRNCKYKNVYVSRKYVGLVHRFVAAHFCPYEDKNFLELLNSTDLQVHHIDGCKNNNMHSNLEWVTQKKHDEYTKVLSRVHCNHCILGITSIK